MTDAIHIPDRINMAEWFLDARLAEGLGERTAIYYRDQQITYRSVVERSCQVTNLLRELGLRIEDRVLLLLLDTPEFAYAYFGVLRAGAVAVPANTWLKTEDYAYYLEYARPRAVIVDAEVYPQLAPALEHAAYPPIVIVVDRRETSGTSGTSGTSEPSAGAALDWSAEVSRQATTATTEPTYRDDFSTWLSSSGSTGKPKCVVHMHHDFIWNTIAYAQRTLGLGPDDITLAAPKLFFGYALASNMLFPFSVGGACVLIPERVAARDYYALLERYKVTNFVTVPTTIAKMIDALGGAEGRDLSALKGLVSAGEALPGRLYRAWKEATGVEIYDGIGSAEMFHIYITNRPGDVKEGSLGKLVDGYTYRLIDDDGRDVATGEIGTLVITGESAGAGYWRMRDRSRATFWGDSVRGSDKFYVDQDGYFWFCGRGDDMLKCSGVYVSPVEVENCLLGHKAVHEAGVVGVRDQAGLEKAMAFVELRPGTTASPELAAEIIAFARGEIAAFKAPRRIAFVDTLPRTDTGKIRRAALRELAAQHAPEPSTPDGSSV